MWAVVTLLAVAGFAAFQIGGREAPIASSADLGRQAGALAGLGFNSAEAQVAIVSVAAASAPAGADSAEASASDAREPAPVDTLPTHGWLSEMQVRALVSMYFQPEDINRAIRVVWCESRFNPTATHPNTGATGLFQHLPEFWSQRAEAAGFPTAEPTDPEANVAAAAEAIYNEGGWDVFACVP
ncbi:hypothetical protein BH23ACT5_BH23ACT5_22750 [soil metagenome]